MMSHFSSPPWKSDKIITDKCINVKQRIPGHGVELQGSLRIALPVHIIPP